MSKGILTKRQVNIILNGGGTPTSRATHWHKRFRQGTNLVVAIALAAVIFGSFEIFAPLQRNLFLAISYFSALLFTVEYALRVWSAPLFYHNRKPGIARLRYIVSFLGIIDFAAILPFILPRIFAGDDQFVFIVEFTKILLIFKLSRYSPAFHMMQAVFKSVRNELVLGIMMALTVVVFSGILMYYVERGAQPEAFNNVGQGFWWSIITFATVGYGDLYPITPLGKVIASVIAFFGIGMIALPTGIIGSAFMKRMSELKGGNQPDRKNEEHPTASTTAAECNDEDSRSQIADPSGESSGSERKHYCPHCGHRLD